MRNIIAVSLLLTILSYATARAYGAEPVERADFREWAERQSDKLDSDWQKAVGRTTGGRARIMKPVFDARGTASMRVYDLQTRSYRSQPGSVNSAGFIHRGITGNYLSLSTRERGAPTRGLNMPASPAEARLRGIRRAPFNSTDFSRNFGASRRGAQRRSPSMGTRIGRSGFRSRGSSIGTLGSTRTRRRR